MTSPTTMTQGFQIDGMSCGSCAARISKALDAELPDLVATIDVASKRLEASFDPARISVTQIVSVVDAAGYGATPL